MNNCPTPDKVPFDSKAAARFFAATDGMRAYRCPCGKWHLTSKRVVRRHPVRR